MEEGEEDKAVKKTFINATILDEDGEYWSFNEGCLSCKKLTIEIAKFSFHLIFSLA